MRKLGETLRNLPHTRNLTIIAQDPSVKVGGKILTAEVQVPAEELMEGPRGFRVNVIDYDASTGALYQPADLRTGKDGIYRDPYSLENRKRKKDGRRRDAELVGDKRLCDRHANAGPLRVRSRTQSGLGQRRPSNTHRTPCLRRGKRIYSREDRGLFFGYFASKRGKPVFTCLAHDVIAHETTHAILDGLRSRYLEPSSPDQAAFHEGFADVVALLSVFSLPDVVGSLLDGSGNEKLIADARLERDALKTSILFGLADEMGEEISQIRGQALRRSVELEPGKPFMSMAEFDEPHERGELLVAAIMNAFLDIWLERLASVGFIAKGKRDRSIVVEEGARVAEHLLTMAIRAIDYCPTIDVNFADYLSALLTIDREVVPDDSRYGYRDALLRNFAAYDIRPAESAERDGTWKRCDAQLTYGRTRFDSMLRDKEEVFRFIWENRRALRIDERGYVEVLSVRPCTRIGPDGFVLRETVAEYVQILTLTVEELKQALAIEPPQEMPHWKRIRIYGGGALIFDEYGQLKYQIANKLEDTERQTKRLHYLWSTGFFDAPIDDKSRFGRLHLERATS